MTMLVQETSSKAPAVEKAFAILSFVGQEKRANFAMIYKRLGLPKSSAHRLVESLVQLGMLWPSGKGRYVLGLRLFELGCLAVRNRTVRRDVVPFMRRLSGELGLVCHLGALEGREAVYLVKVEILRRPAMLNSWEGKRVSLHSSALGKALLAWRPDAECLRILADLPMARKTDATITDAAAFKAHLALVRRQGWAMDEGEDFPDVRCLAVPVRDLSGEVVYALSVSGTPAQLRKERLEKLTSALIGAADGISGALSFKAQAC